MSDNPAKSLEPAIPRPASTVLILRDGRPGIEVFMVVRHHEIDFATGAMVFPGGKVDGDDSAGVWDRLAPPGPGPSRAFEVAALRETFEEAGLLLARRHGASGLIAPDEAQAIVGLHRADTALAGHAARNGARAFAQVIEKEGLTLATDLLVHFAHWITPLHSPKRFDTHFYLVAAPVDQVGLHDGTESVEGVWIAPAQALAEAASGRRTLVPATSLNLEKLARYGSVEERVAATRSAPVVTVCPEVRRRADGGRSLIIPIEAGYGTSDYYVPAERRTASPS